MPNKKDLWTFEETARYLEVSERHLRRRVQAGHLRPVYPHGTGDAMFRRVEVTALLDARLQKLDHPATANLAMQAHCLSRSTAERLEHLLNFLGLTSPLPPSGEEAVTAQHIRVKDVTREKLAGLTAQQVLEWANLFNALDESYLRLVTLYCADQEPWAPYLRVANQLMIELPLQKIEHDGSYRFAYGCLEAARKHLRHVAYFYIRQTFGHAAAEEACVPDTDDEVIAHIYVLEDEDN